jgi:hypothetical protein
VLRHIAAEDIKSFEMADVFHAATVGGARGPGVTTSGARARRPR